MSDTVKKYFSPRLLDYVIFVGPRTSDAPASQTSPSLGNNSRVPHLLRRYPPEDHQDFALPPDVVIFCQPEGCDRIESNVNAYSNPSQTTNSFVFLLTEKDTSRVRYGICLNFYRPLQKCPHKQRDETVPNSSALNSDSKGQEHAEHNELAGQQLLADCADAASQHTASSTQDNESGVRVSTGQDSDSVGSSTRHVGGGIGTRACGMQPASDNTSASFCSGGGGPDSAISSNSGGGKSQTATCEDERGQQQAPASLQKSLAGSRHHHHRSKRSHSRNSNSNNNGGTGYEHTGAARRLNTPSSMGKEKSKVTYALNSICIISHHPFFSTFRECLFIMRKFIQACEDRDLHTSANLNTSAGVGAGAGAGTTKGGGQSAAKCKCHLRQINRIRRNSQNSFMSQTSRKSNPGSAVFNFHAKNCPYSNPIWALLTMPDIDETLVSQTQLNDVAEIEAWILRLLSVPVPVPERTKVEVEVMSASLKQPLLFALPDHTRFSLIDFPLHLPLELLGVETCLQVLTCILLEHKVALQSKDYNALSMSVMAFVTMIYPLEYMFPVIPLLPSCMSSAEQLLLAPTPFIIGFPSSFFKFKCNFALPNDVWIVDLDTNKVKKPPNVEDLPPLPDYEGSILVQNLQKILNAMSGAELAMADTSSGLASSAGQAGGNYHLTPSIFKQTNKNNMRGDAFEGQSSMPSSPFKRRSSMAAAGQLLQFAANKLSGSTVNTNMNFNSSSNSPESTSTRSSFATTIASATTTNINMNAPAFNPISIINNDTDAVDVAVRTAMVRFFNSQEVLANFVEHTRTIRLYPRPVVSFQKSSFIQSRAKISPFLLRLVDTQAVEYMAEWALCPDNLAFQRIQTGVYDPATIGDKPKWYGNQLEPLKYQIWNEDNKEFYEEIASIIKDASNVSGTASSTGKFSDYYDEDDKCGEEQSEPEDEHDYEGTQVGAAGHDALSYDINNNLMGEYSHSAYVSSNDSSPCYSSDRETETNADKQAAVEGRALTLSDVMNIRMRKSSVSSSISSNESWDSGQVMQSIPANYQHDVGRFPPVRCDLSKHFRPLSILVNSRLEAEKLQSGKTISEIPTNTHKERLEAIDSSDDENDSSKVVPDSSSCEESGTEEFDFDAVSGQKKGSADESNVVKLFESIDSDTVVSAGPMNDTASIDENNNATLKAVDKTSAGQGGGVISATDSMDNISANSEFLEQQQPQESQAQRTNGSQLQSGQKPTPGPISDAMSAIINSQKARVTSGVAKLIDRASSIGESKILRQGSQSSPGNQSPLPKNITGEQVGAFFDRVTSEARDAVKEAKAALDVGKNVLKTTAMPAADVGRQKLLKNFQNLGEALFDERRDSSATSEATSQSNDRDELAGGSNHDAKSKPQPAQQNQPPIASKPAPSKGPDFNEMAGKANMIGGWLGSKATGFANRMRDRARPLGPFPSSQKLVQKTRLIRHSTALSDQPEKPQPIRATQSDGDNQQFLKEVTKAVMNGEGIGWLKLNRVKKLMEDESYRDLVLSQINKNLETRIRPDDRISDVLVQRSVWRGMIRLCSAVVSGLEQSYMHNKLVGMASVFSLLEMAHTHYWTKDVESGGHNQGGDAEQTRKSLLDSISTTTDHDTRSIGEETGLKTPMSAKLSNASEITNDSRGSRKSSQSLQDDEQAKSMGDSSTGDRASIPEEQSAFSVASDELGEESRTSLDPANLDLHQAWNPQQGPPQMNSTTLSSGVPLAPINNGIRIYLYEGLLQKDRSHLWDQMQFWEEAFLDAVSHERCLTGMDQGPSEMLERYKLLYEMDKKRLEHEEDRLLSTLLYNMTAFMVMLQVDNHQIKQKIRRLLGKCHISLVNSAEINQLLERIESLKGNDIDLKPMASRQVRRQTFTLHQGTDASGEIVFMEVRDDGLVLRGLDGVIIERWWYERLINMTYSPKNKIVCFWRKSDGQTILSKYYTRKCQDLYNCVKESMQRAVSNYGGNRVCSELGGEFPVLDMKSGEGGILQVCLEGVGLLFATSKYFVRLENIRKCFTQKGGTFVLEEYNPKSHQLIQKHFKSQMADQICYAILCVFSYVAAGNKNADSDPNQTNKEPG